MQAPGPQEPGRSPAGRGLGLAPARPAGGSSERPRPPRCQPVSPHHGWRALLFRLARPGIPDPRRRAGFMSRSQGPGQEPLAPDAGREVGPGAGRCSPRPGGDALPPPCLPVVHTPFGLRSRWAGIVRGAREQALPAPLLPSVRVPGAGAPGRRCPPRLLSFLLSPAPISPLAFKASGSSPGGEGTAEGEST